MPDHSNETIITKDDLAHVLDSMLYTDLEPRSSVEYDVAQDYGYMVAVRHIAKVFNITLED